MNSTSFPLEATLTLPALPATHFICSHENDESLKMENDQNYGLLPFGVSPLHFCPVTSCSTISCGDDVKTIFEMTIDTSDCNFKASPGDSIGIFPENSMADVEFIIQRLGLSESSVVRISENEGVKKISLPDYIPRVSLVKKILLCCLELRAVVKKSLIRCLVECTSYPKERRRLEEFSSKQGSAEYNKWFLEKRTSIIELLKCFPSCNPSLPLLIQHLPRLMPRAYSVANSPLKDPNHIRIIVTLVHHGESDFGVCSGWMYTTFCSDNLVESFDKLSLNAYSSSKVPVFMRKPGNFRIPEDLSKPLIMIGPGTGVAPFLGFLEHIKMLKDSNKNVHFNERWLLFGCRYFNKDFIAKNELEKYKNDGILTQLFTCFSRENIPNSPKYVQDIIHANPNTFASLFADENAYVFICGDARNMVLDVTKKIIECLQEVKGLSSDDAQKFIKEKEKEGKFVKDVWR